MPLGTMAWCEQVFNAMAFLIFSSLTHITSWTSRWWINQAVESVRARESPWEPARAWFLDRGDFFHLVDVDWCLWVPQCANTEIFHPKVFISRVRKRSQPQFWCRIWWTRSIRWPVFEQLPRTGTFFRDWSRKCRWICSQSYEFARIQRHSHQCSVVSVCTVVQLQHIQRVL